MIIADTDVLIDFLRGKGEAERVANELRSGNLHTTSISAFELWSGAKNSLQLVAVDKLLQALIILPLTAKSAKTAGQIRCQLESEGRTIGMADSLIAGICVLQKGILMTRNRKHFERVPQIKLHTPIP